MLAHMEPRGHLRDIESDGLAFDGPTCIVGPSKIGGCTRPIWVTHPLRRFYILYALFSSFFLRVGLTAFSDFAGDVASCGALDRFALIKEP